MQLVLHEIFPYPSNKRISYGPGTESLKPCTQLFVPLKRRSLSEGELPRGYLINIAKCLFPYHKNRH